LFFLQFLVGGRGKIKNFIPPPMLNRVKSDTFFRNSVYTKLTFLSSRQTVSGIRASFDSENENSEKKMLLATRQMSKILQESVKELRETKKSMDVLADKVSCTNRLSFLKEQVKIDLQAVFVFVIFKSMTNCSQGQNLKTSFKRV